MCTATYFLINECYEFRSASKGRCGQGYDRCLQTLLSDVVVPETHRNSLRELKLWVTKQEFCIVGGYMEDIINHWTVKIGGWALAQGWALARDNTVLQNGFIPSMSHKISLVPHQPSSRNAWGHRILTLSCNAGACTHIELWNARVYFEAIWLA